MRVHRSHSRVPQPGGCSARAASAGKAQTLGDVRITWHKHRARLRGTTAAAACGGSATAAPARTSPRTRARTQLRVQQPRGGRRGPDGRQAPERLAHYRVGRLLVLHARGERQRLLCTRPRASVAPAKRASVSLPCALQRSLPSALLDNSIKKECSDVQRAWPTRERGARTLMLAPPRPAACAPSRRASA